MKGDITMQKLHEILRGICKGGIYGMFLAFNEGGISIDQVIL